MSAESPAADMGRRGGKTEWFARGYMWKLWQGTVVLLHLFFLTNSLTPSLFCDESWEYQYITKYKWHVGIGWNSAKHLTAAEVAKNEEQKSFRFTSPKCKQHLFKLPHKDQLSSFKDITKTFKLHNTDEKLTRNQHAALCLLALTRWIKIVRRQWWRQSKTGWAKEFCKYSHVEWVRDGVESLRNTTQAKSL